jgi:hypothetical protein
LTAAEPPSLRPVPLARLFDQAAGRDLSDNSATVVALARGATLAAEQPPEPPIGTNEPNQQRNQRAEGNSRRNEPGRYRAGKKTKHRQSPKGKKIGLWEIARVEWAVKSACPLPKRRTPEFQEDAV